MNIPSLPYPAVDFPSLAWEIMAGIKKSIRKSTKASVKRSFASSVNSSYTLILMSLINIDLLPRNLLLPKMSLLFLKKLSLNIHLLPIAPSQLSCTMAHLSMLTPWWPSSPIPPPPTILRPSKTQLFLTTMDYEYNQLSLRLPTMMSLLWRTITRPSPHTTHRRPHEYILQHGPRTLSSMPTQKISIMIDRSSNIGCTKHPTRRSLSPSVWKSQTGRQIALTSEEVGLFIDSIYTGADLWED